MALFVGEKASLTGTATITATTTDGTDLSDTCRVTVIRYVSSIELNEDEITLLAGETKKLTATVNPTDATHRSLSWTSSAPDVATVEDGTVTARSNGSATIVAASTDGSHIQAVCRVTVKTPVNSICSARHSWKCGQAILRCSTRR